MPGATKCSKSSGGVIGAKRGASEEVPSGGPGGVPGGGPSGVPGGGPGGVPGARLATTLCGKPIGKIHADLNIANAKQSVHGN